MQLRTVPAMVADGRLLTPGWLLHDETVREYGEGPAPARVHGPATGHTAVPGGVLAPGLVDVQLNGAFGLDFAAGDREWSEVARRLPSTGGDRVRADADHSAAGAPR